MQKKFLSIFFDVEDVESDNNVSLASAEAKAMQPFRVSYPDADVIQALMELALQYNLSEEEVGCIKDAIVLHSYALDEVNSYELTDIINEMMIEH